MATTAFLTAQAGKVFHGYLEELITLKRYTVTSLARILSCDRSTVHRIRNAKGMARIKRSYAVKLAAATGLHKGDLLRTRLDRDTGVFSSLTSLKEAGYPRARMLAIQKLSGTVQMYLFDNLGVSITSGYGISMMSQPRVAWWMMTVGHDKFCVVCDLTKPGHMGFIGFKIKSAEGEAAVTWTLQECSNATMDLIPRLTASVAENNITYSNFSLACLRRFVTFVKRHADIKDTALTDLKNR